jgi:hypothetical protein
MFHAHQVDMGLIRREAADNAQSNARRARRAEHRRNPAGGCRCRRRIVALHTGHREPPQRIQFIPEISRITDIAVGPQQRVVISPPCTISARRGILAPSA